MSSNITQDRMIEERRKLSDFISLNSDDLLALRQNSLMKEDEFIRFTRGRGVSVNGVLTGDPSLFLGKGLLKSDGLDYAKKPTFHPFRIVPLRELIAISTLRLSHASFATAQEISENLPFNLRWIANTEKLNNAADLWNGIVDLAIILEPIYWPKITGWRSNPAVLPENEYQEPMEINESRIRDLVLEMDSATWEELHQKLRLQAAQQDENGALYLLLRFSTWHQRKQLRGHISGALWFRYIAELVRFAFEDIHGVTWLEEDRAFGQWPLGARQRLFGSERPIDQGSQSISNIIFSFGINTGSLVRWYVEGETEYFTIKAVIEDPARFGIELVNLKGKINSADFHDMLFEDCNLRRFSIVCFDTDVRQNVKFMRKQIEGDNLVGLIGATTPDFEFANFTLDELIDISANFDDLNGFNGDSIRNASWSGVSSAKGFKNNYRSLSERKVKIGAENWGLALAEYLQAYPTRASEDDLRPFWQHLRSAIRCKRTYYDEQKENYTFDLTSFELIRRNAT